MDVRRKTLERCEVKYRHFFVAADQTCLYPCYVLNNPVSLTVFQPFTCP